MNPDPMPMPSSRNLEDGLDRATSRLRYEAALTRFEVKLWAFRNHLLELRYVPDQPRVPAGNPDGGEWTDIYLGATTPPALGDGSSSAAVQLVAAKKPDIQFITYLCRKYGLDPDDRERLHEAITGQDMSREEIESEAQSLAAGDEDE